MSERTASPADRPVYLDHAATTPVHPAVRAAMEPFLGQAFGNPSSRHAPGRYAAAAIETARAQVAAALGCQPDEIIFTSGGSESNSLAVAGVLGALRARGRRHLVTTTIEHPSILAAVGAAERSGEATVTRVAVDGAGLVDPAAVASAVRPDTALVSVMLANNEIGAIQPVGEIARLARSRGTLVHTDAVQGAGMLDLNVAALDVDLLTLSAHKHYAPKGTGVLFVKRGTPLAPVIHGGSQERGRRAGTENVAGIVACGAALELVTRHREASRHRLSALADRLIAGIEQRIPRVLLNGPREGRLPGNVNVCFGDVQAETVLIELDLEGVYASSGSACHAGSTEPSHVLLALGRPPAVAHTALRLSLGLPTTDADIDRVLEVLPPLVARLRATRDPGARAAAASEAVAGERSR